MKDFLSRHRKDIVDLLIALPIINFAIMFLVLQFIHATTDDIVKHGLELFAFYVLSPIVEIILYLIVEYITEKYKSK
jgi:hypothetical protein